MINFKSWLNETFDSTVWYHGTNSAFLPMIMQQGLRNPYMTSVFELAKYYAEASEGEGNPVVLKIKIDDTSNFTVDNPSLEEPVGYGNVLSKNIETKIRRLYKKNNSINDSDWRLTYPVTKTVKYQGVLPSNKIIEIINID